MAGTLGGRPTWHGGSARRRLVVQAGWSGKLIGDSTRFKNAGCGDRRAGRRQSAVATRRAPALDNAGPEPRGILLYYAQ